MFFFFFSSRRRHTRYIGDWSSDVCSSDLGPRGGRWSGDRARRKARGRRSGRGDRKSTRLNSSHRCISYAVFCLKKKKDERMENTGGETDRKRKRALETST